MVMALFLGYPMKILMCLKEEEAPGGRCFQMVVSFLVAIISHKKQKFGILRVSSCSVTEQRIGHFRL